MKKLATSNRGSQINGYNLFFMKPRHTQGVYKSNPECYNEEREMVIYYGSINSYL